VITLVLGGMRSGKSEVAERVAAAAGAPVTYIATAIGERGDPGFDERIARHRARRPSDWITVEAGADLVAAVEHATGTVLVDTLGTWVSLAPGFSADVAGLCRALRTRTDDTVLVSDEVGLSVHPATDAGRRFADALGECNRAVASIADRALLVVAGRALELGAI
jgi:adenosyl cobinamide kinase/adenosyl cobinamide phosphate guanylyltransferase